MASQNKYAEQLTDNAIEEVSELYEDAYYEIYEYLLDVLDYNKNPNFTKIPMSEIIENITDILDELRYSISVMIEEKIEEAVELGYSENEYAYLLAIGVLASLRDVYYDLDSDLVSGELKEQLTGETLQALLSATNNAEYKVIQIIKETFAKHNAMGYMKEDNNTLTKMLLAQITAKGLSIIIQNGIIGIVDKAGRRWKLHTYVEMLIKTKYHEARVKGMQDYVYKHGFGDLAVIPIVGSLDDCSEFEGTIISLTGLTEGFPTYDELESTDMIFHPRCRHTPIPFYDIKALDKKDLKYWEEHSEEVWKIIREAANEW